MRGVHFVGGYPAPTIESAMRAMIDGAATGLQLVPDGETGRWCGIRDELTALPTCVGSASYGAEARSGASGIPRSSLRPGPEAPVSAASRATLAAFDYLRRATVARSILDRLECEYGRQFTLQQGLPHYHDGAALAFSPGQGADGVPRVPADLFAEHLQRQIHAIIATVGADRVLFQIDSPHAVRRVVDRSIRTSPDLAVDAAGAGMAKVINRATPQARFGIHLCLREVFDSGLRRSLTMVPVVAVLDAITDALERPEALEYVHFAFGTGDIVPSLDRDVYRPLTGLRDRLPGETRIVAGLADERQPLSEQLLLRDLTEDIIGEPVDIAAGCGLGRAAPDVAARVATRMVELAST